MSTATLASIEELSHFVHQKLCAAEDLDPRYTPLFRMVVHKQGKPCGLFFHMQGPRMVRSYAVWSAEKSQVFFYNGKGSRTAEIMLSEGPDVNAIQDSSSIAQ